MWSRASGGGGRACANRAPGRSLARGAGEAARAALKLSVPLALGALALAQLDACSSTPQRSKTPAATASSPTTAPPAAAPGKSAGAGAKDAAGGAAGAAAAAAAVHPEVTPAAR